jgi:hypothetical protein
VIEVRPGGRRRIDRVLGPGYLSGLGDLPLKVLRERRDEAAQEETDLSYLRRLLHARIDIVRAEQKRASSTSWPRSWRTTLSARPRVPDVTSSWSRREPASTAATPRP